MKNVLTNWYVASVMPPVDDTISKHRYQGWSPCVKWCAEQFGDSFDADWNFVGEGIFEFKNERDCAWFLLRWSS